VVSNGLKFCCNGCRTVYEMLHENKLYTYYNLEKSPGIRLETTEFGNKYEFLDNAEIAGKFLVFREGEVAKVRFYIPVIHCASCIWLLEHLGKLHPGIKYSSVNFVRKEVDITFHRGEISLRQLVELLGSIHYIPDLSQSLQEEKPEKHSYKKLLYKIGVAGFVFLNVMTYSLPAYFNGKPVEGSLGRTLAILSFILVIPVVFFSGSDYYISAWKNLKKKSISIDLPIAIGIFVLFAVTAFEVISGRGAGYSDSLSGLVFFLLVGKWYQGKSYEALSFERNYKSYFPIAVTRIREGAEDHILLEKVEPGDFLLIRNKELIPADAILEEGTGMIDYSFVTGESTPVMKKKGDFLYAGGRQMGGIIRVRVEKDIQQSHLTHLWNQDKSYEKPLGNLKNLTDRVSQYFTLTVIAIALGGFAGWMWHGDAHMAVFVFTAVLIVACPCALALSVPFTFGNTMRIFGRKGLYIKNSDVIEKLSHVDTLVFDKTGTLTFPDVQEISYSGTPLTPGERDALFSLARQSAHPMSQALVAHLRESNYVVPGHFVEVQGRGVFGKVGEQEVRYGSREYVTGEPTSNGSGSILQVESDLISGAGALPETGSGSEVHVAFDGHETGVFRISNHYREGMEEVIRLLNKKFELYLLSGDNDAERKNLTRHFPEENLFFDCKPQEKADFIARLQKEGKRVLMTGDGLNDAGALMQSDVALSVANTAYQFSPASDAVLESGKFGLLARFIAFTHTARNIVYISFAISFLYNIFGMGIALSGLLSPVIAAILMPISSVSVVAFATLTTRLAGRTLLKETDK
jgi:Cu+-exporting ATPase